LRVSTFSSSSAPFSGTTEYRISGFDQLAAFGEQRLGGALAEIVQGERVGALPADLAKLPLIGLLAMAQDDDARRRGESCLGAGGEQQRGKDGAAFHGAGH
jgi:hypothetical protein